jgi:HK97 family phage portal protein
VISRLTGGLWSRQGGNGWSRFRFLLPGSRFDYEGEAGDLWLNPVVGLCLDWLGNRFPRPLVRVSRIATRNGEGHRAGDFVPLARHDLIDLWNRPNPHYGRRTLEKAIGLSLKTDGNAYLYKVRDRGGRVAQLWWLPHFRVSPTWPSDGSAYIDGYKVRVDAGEYTLPPEDIIHIRDGIDPRNERIGLCALRACVREVCTINEESGYRAAILRNSAVPSLAIVPDNESLRPTKDDADVIRERLWEATGGDNRGKPVIMAGQYRLEKIGYSPEEMNLIEFPTIPTARILASLGVAPMSLGLPDPGKTYANLGEANRTSWGTIVACQELVAEALRWQLLPDFGADPHGLVVEYVYDQIQEMQESLDAVWTRTTRAWRSGMLQLNEAREIVGLEPDPDGDRWFPGTGSPDEIARQHEEDLLYSGAMNRSAQSKPKGPQAVPDDDAEADDDGMDNLDGKAHSNGVAKRWQY